MPCPTSSAGDACFRSQPWNAKPETSNSECNLFSKWGWNKRRRPRICLDKSPQFFGYSHLQVSPKDQGLLFFLIWALRIGLCYVPTSFTVCLHSRLPSRPLHVLEKNESDQQTHQVKAFETRRLGCMNCHRWIAWLACPFVCDWNAGKTARFPGSDSTCASFQNFFVDTLRRTAMQAGTSSDGVVILPRISTLQKNSHMTAKWIRPQKLCKCPASEIFKDTFGSILNQHAQSVVKSDINQHGPTAPAWAVQCAAGRGHGSPVSESVTLTPVWIVKLRKL